MLIKNSNLIDKWIHKFNLLLFKVCVSNKVLYSLYIKCLSKEHKQESQCAVICGFIKNFLPNSYFILQIHHAKALK